MIAAKAKSRDEGIKHTMEIIRKKPAAYDSLKKVYPEAKCKLNRGLYSSR